MMNEKIGELKIDKWTNYHDKMIKALEDAGLVLVLTCETTTEKHYIVAGRKDE